MESGDGEKKMDFISGGMGNIWCEGPLPGKNHLFLGGAKGLFSVDGE